MTSILCRNTCTEMIIMPKEGEAEKNMASCLQISTRAKLTRTSRVSIDDSHWPSYTTWLELIYSKRAQKPLSTSTIRSWDRIHERKCKFVTTRVVNLAKYGHDFTTCFITRILIRCYYILYLNKISTGRRMNQLSNDTSLSRVSY